MLKCWDCELLRSGRRHAMTTTTPPLLLIAIASRSHSLRLFSQFDQDPKFVILALCPVMKIFFKDPFRGGEVFREYSCHLCQRVLFARCCFSSYFAPQCKVHTFDTERQDYNNGDLRQKHQDIDLPLPPQSQSLFTRDEIKIVSRPWPKIRGEGRAGEKFGPSPV